jgi:D-inositol-3-phosphate glycosyltransferase
MSIQSNILVVGWGADSTGMSRVLEQIGKSLSTTYQVHYFAINKKEPSIHTHFKLYHQTIDGDTYGEKQLLLLLQDIQPKLVLIHYDFWLFEKYVKIFKNFPHIKVIMYCLSDGEFHRSDLLSSLKHLDHIVSYTKYGQSELHRVFTELGEQAPPISVIGHGVDRNIFFPLFEDRGFSTEALNQRRQIARRELWEENPDLEDAFIVLNANANRARKMLAHTIWGFEKFAADKPANVKLYLHADLVNRQPVSRKLGLSLRRLWNANRLLLSTELFPAQPLLSNEQLNLLYNACDVGINTASAEGWGLISCEHATTGAPQIIPRHTNLTEIWEGSAIMMEPVRKGTIEALNINEFYVDETKVAISLEKLYRSPETLSAYAAHAYHRMKEIEFDWEYIGQQWIELVQNVLTNPIKQSIYATAHS